MRIIFAALYIAFTAEAVRLDTTDKPLTDSLNQTDNSSKHGFVDWLLTPSFSCNRQPAVVVVPAATPAPAPVAAAAPAAAPAAAAPAAAATPA